MSDELKINNPRLAKLAEAFVDLRHRDMMELAEVVSEALEAQNGQVVKPQVFAEVLDSLGEYIAIETEGTAS